MQVILTGASVSDKVQNYIRGKVEKLSKFFSKAEQAKVEMHEYHSRKNGRNFRVEITVDVARKFVRGEEYGQSFEEACDLAVEKVEKQLRRYKTKLIDKYRQPSENELVGEDAPTPEETARRIARVKHFKIKPMDIEEAIMQMDLSGHDFYIFSHQEANEMNVLYRRSNGTLGLLIPEA
ncbi:ribosome-associated translation inhibitor RaiA [bacterium]|nr:ribosome-associated translation inhibitor RaiA [bacterium]